MTRAARPDRLRADLRRDVPRLSGRPAIGTPAEPPLARRARGPENRRWPAPPPRATAKADPAPAPLGVRAAGE
ncbi:MAG: hypothetical protein LBR80_19270 [Deltaproteobacteria bacterium]|nr:hypothetical protein [Deltaproteobacteria bacterium]